MARFMSDRDTSAHSARAGACSEQLNGSSVRSFLCRWYSNTSR